VVKLLLARFDVCDKVARLELKKKKIGGKARVSEK
jgi:hypothetical protein